MPGEAAEAAEAVEDDLAPLRRLAAAALGAEEAALQVLARRRSRQLQQAVFAVRSPRVPTTAAKSFLLRGSSPAARRRVRRELLLARWASDRGLGAPVLGSECAEDVAVLLMEQACDDLERFHARRSPPPPFPLLRELWRAAFALVRDGRLVSQRLVCADLKPSNLLIFAEPSAAGASAQDDDRALPAAAACDFATAVKRGRGVRSRRDAALRLRLADFDPRFWARVESRQAAARLNAVFLLANSVFWRPQSRLGAFLPQEALELAAALRRREPSLLALLRRHEGLLRKGPMHYHGARTGVKCADLEQLLLALDDALSCHALPLPAKQ
jgi:hypothetical protein